MAKVDSWFLYTTFPLGLGNISKNRLGVGIKDKLKNLSLLNIAFSNWIDPLSKMISFQISKWKLQKN